MDAPDHHRRWPRLSAAAREEIDQLLAAMPLPVRTRAGPLPVCFEPKPSDALIRDGLDPDLLGLFSGETFPDGVTGGDPLPAQITLYLDNLWEYAGGDLEVFRAEVHRTYLHELGHYLGLDEDDLVDRDLD